MKWFQNPDSRGWQGQERRVAGSGAKRMALRSPVRAGGGDIPLARPGHPG